MSTTRGPLALPRGRARSILGLLALRRNSVVGTERIIDTVWGEAAPDSARKSVQTHIWRLRRLLGGTDSARVEGWGHGYLLRLQPGELDIDSFEASAVSGERLLSAGEFEAAARCLREALNEFHGEPLHGVRFGGTPPGDLLRLEERRLVVQEHWIEAELYLGRAQYVIPEIQALLLDNPLRERLYGQLMASLYHCGRRMEALQTFAAARRLLHSAYGMEPSPVLQQLQRAILADEAPDELAFIGRPRSPSVR
ncbi:AfsR/SARP family transcriptional regulator [Streptomyces milbemycinicus]|uniref:AfsR/SARP family transcriptional regulator n=1 Tax=Streptomyces milbemycinicus TaxID=476552 RepID=UPI0033FD8DF7